MKTRLTALALALLLALGAALPALAAETAVPVGGDSAPPPALGDGISDEPMVLPETDAVLDGLAAKTIDPVLREQIQERIGVIKDLRAQDGVMSDEMRAQHDTNQALWQSVTGDVGPARDQVLQYRDELRAWLSEEVQPLKDQLNSLQERLANARQNSDTEAARTIAAEMQAVRAQLQALAGPMQAKREDGLTLVSDLRARRDSLQPKLEEIRSLREESQAVYEGIVSLREEKAAVWQSIRDARQAGDAASVLAGLDQVISLKQQILAERGDRLDIARQIGTILGGID